MSYYATFAIAAVAEISGCFASRFWLGLDKSVWCEGPETGLLVLFVYSLSRIDISFAWRVFAAYGGLYIATSQMWQCIVKKDSPMTAETLKHYWRRHLYRRAWCHTI